jgi:outer membrane protein assembly factor BamB
MTAPVDSSPTIGAVVTIYIGSVNGVFYALAPENGVPRWEFKAGSFISSSPALSNDGQLYFGTGSGLVVALNLAGEEQWSFQTGARIFSSPAIGRDGTVYIGSSDGFLYALNPDGGQRWRFATAAPILGSPAIAWDGTIYIGSADQTLYAITPDGTMKWSFFTGGLIDASPVIGADSTVYFASGDHFFYALNPDGPAETRMKWRISLGAPSASTAAIRGDGVIIVGTDGGWIRALNPNGSERWFVKTEDDIYSSPAIAKDGAIYVGSTDGRLFKIAGNGSPLSTVSSWPRFQRDSGQIAQAPPANGARLINLSARAAVAPEGILIAGFFVQGESGQPFLIRAVGPSLAQFGVSNFMPDPKLDLFSDQRLMRSNNDWGDQQDGGAGAASLQTFPLPLGSKDAAMIPSLSSGLYTTHVSSANGEGGVVLVEAYDIRGSDPNARLLNLSIRSQVGLGEESLIAGFVVQGTAPSRLLIRAVGPGLTQFGVGGALARPTLTVYRHQERLLTNTGWSTGGVTYDLIGAAKTVAAFPLQSGSADSAVAVTLEPGSYTVQVSGVGETTGEALAEIYVLP